MKQQEKEYNKIIEYRNYKFNICVKVNYDGREDLNQVIVNDMGGGNFYKKNTVDNLNLMSHINYMTDEIKKYVDKRQENYLSNVEQLLLNTGFS